MTDRERREENRKRNFDDVRRTRKIMRVTERGEMHQWEQNAVSNVIYCRT